MATPDALVLSYLRRTAAAGVRIHSASGVARCIQIPSPDATTALVTLAYEHPDILRVRFSTECPNLACNEPLDLGFAPDKTEGSFLRKCAFCQTPIHYSPERTYLYYQFNGAPSAVPGDGGASEVSAPHRLSGLELSVDDLLSRAPEQARINIEKMIVNIAGGNQSMSESGPGSTTETIDASVNVQGSVGNGNALGSAVQANPTTEATAPAKEEPASSLSLIEKLRAIGCGPAVLGLITLAGIVVTTLGTALAAAFGMFHFDLKLPMLDAPEEAPVEEKAPPPTIPGSVHEGEGDEEGSNPD